MRIHSRHVPVGRKTVKRNAYARAHGIDTAPVPSGPIAEYIEQLNQWGITSIMIAQASGRSDSVIQRIRGGEYATTQRRTAAQILAVTHLPHPHQSKCLAVGAIRRIHALQALGWRLVDIEKRTGLTAPQLKAILGETRTSYTRWKIICAAYEQMSGEPGPSVNTRARAKYLGYAAPLAWEDLDIDHPDTQPDWRAAGIKRADRPVCPNNHRYTTENTLLDSRGHRQCRICRRAAKTKARTRQHAA